MKVDVQSKQKAARRRPIEKGTAMERGKRQRVGWLLVIALIAGLATSAAAAPAQTEVAITIDDSLRTIPQNGEIFLSGSFVSDEDAAIGFEGEVLQGESRTFLGPESIDLTAGFAFGFDMVTRDGQGPRFGPGPATVTVRVFDRAIPEITLGEATVTRDVSAPRIVFHRGTVPGEDPDRYEIFTMNEDGSDVVRLTHNRTVDEYPSFSPGSTFIAFSRNGDIYKMRANGTKVQQVTSGKRTDALPEWSPDGRWIVFTRHIGRQGDIFKIRSNGNGDAVRLTDTASSEFAPEWSPDGRTIAFTRTDYRNSRQGIGVVKANGTGLRWLTRNPDETGGYSDGFPTWSPDGSRLAFAREHSYEIFSDLFVVDVASGEVTQVTDLQGLVEVPTWSPDDRIAFMYEFGIAVISEDGTGMEQITEFGPGTRQFQWPDWAPAPPLG